MKNLLFAIMLLFATTASPQKDVTKFLGIPVDGTKNAMIDKLIDKGFTYNKAGDYLEGEFNGKTVQLHVVTNNNKVYRIVVNDVLTVDEGNIKIQFNRLCQQFKNNKHYFAIKQQEIPEDTDISHEIIVKDKRFEASFYQDVDFSAVDTTACMLQVKEIMTNSYSQEELKNPTEEMWQKMFEMYKVLCFARILEVAQNKSVWFMITYYKGIGQYGITMYYDNGYNQANGEDL